MRFYSTFIFLFSAIAVFANNPNQTVQIRGTVRSPTSPDAKITIFSDPLQLSGENYILTVGGDQRFALDLQLENPQFGELQYGNFATPIWLEPGKTLDISFNGLDVPGSLGFSGDGGPANGFLKNFRLKFPELPQRIEQFMSTADADSYKKFILALAAERKNALESDPLFLQSSPEFQVLFSKNENFWTGYQLLRFPFDKPLFEDKWEPLQLPEPYFDFLSRMHVSTNGLLQSPDYVPFLEKFLDFQKMRPENANLSQRQLAEKFLTGEAAWYFQAKEIALNFRGGKFEQAKTELENFNAACQNGSLKNGLQMVALQSRPATAGMEAPNFGLTDANGNMVSLSDLRGKVVFLDFWATWCGHCVEEMPNIQRLTQNFSSGEVAVVFISFDKDPAAWRSFVQSRWLGGTHLWGESLSNSLVGKMYGVKALPASFLIDQTGKIVKAGSGGTSVEEISRAIEGLLKNGQ